MNMAEPSPLPKVALIAGPTASGKSSLAMAVAERTGGVIVNADSAQVYADLRIVTARPSEAEETALPHRLFGYIDGAEACSAARWAADAMTSIEEAEKQGKPAILVGGTGLYHRTLLEGIAPIPEIDPDIRAAVRALAVADAHEALRREDPEAATRLKPADTTRVARALEIVRSTGRPIAAWQMEKSGGIADRISLAPLILLPNRDWLYSRCNARFADMIESGAVEEVEALAARNLDPDLPIMRAIGVPEILDFLAGNTSKEETVAAAAQATRRYAKRQYTWFSNQPPADWARIDESQYNDYSHKIVTILQQ
ncbi:tRNA (adenosine(37)-N6)-dimethylallyltransferase MiaA [Parasphingopyxis marina]|uniref:tRNA dimethylallyltransferase n=1 Tax=Parasphingopyxis marina TaxID=2761622 RepID=A0A842I0A9_9SPHN|nr:tRNA (adenosine(37)-N6)-dimethylallyltransferase MiaA [Parasphingopyxis marina]MBC2778113.1 tRNA (adenosine(37)-N6)-dimethylallyltransferase MiaA [Parasphingopyxis marina]